MLAIFLASTPLLSESWKLCSHANSNSPPDSFVRNSIGDTTYVAFSGVQAVAGFSDLVPLHEAGCGLFPALHRHDEAQEPVMVHAGFLHLFLSMQYNSQFFQNQMFDIMQKSKSVVFTGHSIGGAIASLSALWFLSYLQSISSPLSVLCITFGSPLLGNDSLSKAILQERWGGKFCNVIGKHDIVPRLFFSPITPLTPYLHSLFKLWHHSMTSPNLRQISVQLQDETKTELFRFVLAHLQAVAYARDDSSITSSFWPFGSYVFCTNEGAICVDNAMTVVRLLYLLFATGTADSSVDDHLLYEEYVGKVSLQFFNGRNFIEEQISESSYEAGVDLAIHSSGIAKHESVSGPVKDCLRMAKRMGHMPNLNCASLAIAVSKINPLRAQIEWYKASCDESDDQMGYYDSFKLSGASKRDFKVNMNRIKLGSFWNNVIKMLETNQLPQDFQKREKWINASQFYKLLVEPLDIAEYYRRGMHRQKGHYMEHGRARRYHIFDRWWRESKVGEEENDKRSKFASLTQDSCFWARVEEAKEWLEHARSERDTWKLSVLWENLDKFEQYTRRMIERKVVSRDVVVKNSSYSLWIQEWSQLKSHSSISWFSRP